MAKGAGIIGVSVTAYEFYEVAVENYEKSIKEDASIDKSSANQKVEKDKTKIFSSPKSQKASELQKSTKNQPQRKIGNKMRRVLERPTQSPKATKTKSKRAPSKGR